MSFSANFPAIQPSLLLDFANTGTLDPRITFTRATPATYYDGVTTAKAGENLILWSQEFQQSAWTAATIDNTVTVNTTVAPDGTTTADTIAFGAAGYRYNSYSPGSALTGRTFTFSCWVWSTTGKTGIGVRIAGNTTGTDQTFLSVSLTSTATRVSVTRTFTSADTTLICGFDNRSGLGGNDIAGNVVVWGAQLEERSTATAYNLTTTQTITNYIPVLQTAPAGVARFDHNPTTGESLGLEVEEQRTNLLSFSAQFDNAAWGKDGGISVLPNQAVAPDGTVAFDQMTRVAGTLGNWAQLTQAVSVGAGGNVGRTYTFSVWLQALPTAGTVSGVLSISDVFYNTYTSAFTATTTPTRFSFTTSGGAGWNAAGSLIGGGVSLSANNTSVLVWGAQLEISAFSTSYIATVATAQTRNADIVVMTGTNLSSWFSNAEGTLYVEAYGCPTTVNRSIVRLNSSASGAVFSDSIYLDQDAGSVRGVVFNGSSGQAVLSPLATNPSTSQTVKVAMAYKTNDFAGSANGGTVLTDTSGLVPAIIPTHFHIGTQDAIISWSSPIKKIAYYPVRLTNAQVRAITSV